MSQAKKMGFLLLWEKGHWECWGLTVFTTLSYKAEELRIPRASGPQVLLEWSIWSHNYCFNDLWKWKWSLSRVQLFAIPGTAAYEAPLSMGFSRQGCQEPAHEIPPMTKSWGENLIGKADQVFRDSEKLPPVLSLKMISIILMPPSIDYSLISVTQAEGLPRSLSK